LRGGTSCCGSRKRPGEKLGEAEAGKRVAEAARESVHAEVDDETDEEIPARIAAAADRAQAEASLQRYERKLAKISDGRTIAALDTEVAAIVADLLDSELARLQLESERLTQDREEAAADEQRLAALRNPNTAASVSGPRLLARLHASMRRHRPCGPEGRGLSARPELPA
jgi:hypothetical protein